MLTIKDIAKKAKVSEGTVDRVIHNRGGVSKKTKAKINKILEQHNFKVNPVASALALKNKHLIATLLPEYNDSDIFWKSPYQGILKGGDDVKSFGVAVKNFTFNQTDPKTYLNAFNNLLETTPSAVIIVPVFLEQTKQIVSRLESLNIPYSFLNIDIEGFKNIAFVGQDSYMAGYVAGKLMLLSISKMPTILILQVKNKTTKNNSLSNRVKGFEDYFLEQKLHSKILKLKLENLENPSETKEKLNSYLEQNPKTSGIFVPSSRIHVIVKALSKERLKNLNLIGFDNTSQNITCLRNGSISFLISQKPFEQGYKSVRLLSDFLLKNEISNPKLYLPIDILIKENVSYNEYHELS